MYLLSSPHDTNTLNTYADGRPVPGSRRKNDLFTNSSLPAGHNPQQTVQGQ